MAAAGTGTTSVRPVSCFDGAAAAVPPLTPTWWAAPGPAAVPAGNAPKERSRATEPAAERELAPVS
ncbi:hypothetical protein FNH09_11450 [Streptomyces adustus]|uniref:Uncharacterized protein n=1 Tax=Streptomyces adustus TaxID=1609272 RepID=A0A5N8V9D0_9ACTN|nr:hypothetical protein [Streptomyces adustus]